MLRSGCLSVAMAGALTLVSHSAFSQAAFEGRDQNRSESAVQFALGLSSRLDVEKSKDITPWPSFRLYWFQGSSFAWSAGISHSRQTTIRFLDRLDVGAIMLGGRLQTSESKTGGFAEAYFDIRRYDAEYQHETATDTTYSIALVIGAYHRFSRRLAADLSWHGVFGRIPDIVTFAPESGGMASIQKDAYNPVSLELHVRLGL